MKQGWEIKKLGEVCTFQRGLTYSKDDEVEHSNNCVLRSNNIDLDSMSIVLDELKYINDDFAVSEDKKVKPNTILICMSNGSKQHIGKVAFIDKEYGYAFGGFMGLIRPNAEVSPKFIYYSCISSSYKHFLAGIGNGANITNLKFSDLQQYTLPIPPIAEQERIVAELNCLSGIIEKKREQLKELDALAESIFYTMFGDDVGKLNKWESCSIGDIYKFQYGKGNKIPESKGKYPCYGSNGQVGFHTEFNGEDSPIIGHIGAYAGIVIWASGKHYVTYNGVICKLKHNGFNPIYGFYLLKAQNYMDSARGGAAQPFVSYDMLEAPIVYMPPIALQQEFADKIEAIEKQKELIKESIKETEELFNSRMDYYFN